MPRFKTEQSKTQQICMWGFSGLDIKSFSTFSTSISLPWHKLTQIDQGCIIYWKTLRPLEHLYWARPPWSWKLDLLGLQDTGTLGFSLGTAGCWIPSKLQALKPGKGKSPWGTPSGEITHRSMCRRDDRNKPVSIAYKESLGKPLVLSWLYKQDSDCSFYPTCWD
jgi:hypothetical protein